MKAISDLQRVSRYLENLTVAGKETYFATNTADATAYLKDLTGEQTVAARPELHGPIHRPSIDTVIFVLAPALGAARTPQAENQLYDALLRKVETVINGLYAATNQGCAELIGLEITNMDITPELSLFGGWQGWSIEVTFE